MLTAIKNGVVYDGTGNTPARKNILLRGDRIMRIDEAPVHEADIIIDALGSIVMPGVINVGSRADKTSSLFSDPRQEAAILEGITTQIIGNDGISLAPSSPHMSGEFEPHHTERSHIVHDWRRTRDITAFLEKRGIGTNVGTLVGFSNIRAMVARGKQRDFTEQEFRACLTILRESLEDGALGLSAVYTEGEGHLEGISHEEVKELMKLLAETERICVLRLPRHGIRAAFEDLIEYTRSANINAELNFTRPFEDSPDAYNELSDFMGQLSGKGYVHFDLFPFPEATVRAEALLPAWAKGVNREATLEMLSSEGMHDELLKYFKTEKEIGMVIIRVADPSLRFLEGKSVRDFARNRGRSYERGLVELLRLTKLRVLFRYPEGDLAIQKFITHSNAIMSWDTAEQDVKGPLDFLKRMDEEKLVTLEQAVEKMTSLPAKKYGISKRGVLAPGNYADIVIARDFKVTHVFVNGEPAIGEYATRALNGSIITS
ncbi:MAG: amidohydrolase family protein [Candidatus Jorgensenbacteria bacterium]|nr:amidohydrolase family protein [Candidatus Jorgensenbacteria bacterium]